MDDLVIIIYEALREQELYAEITCMLDDADCRTIAQAIAEAVSTAGWVR